MFVTFVARTESIKKLLQEVGLDTEDGQALRQLLKDAQIIDFFKSTLEYLEQILQLNEEQEVIHELEQKLKERGETLDPNINKDRLRRLYKQKVRAWGDELRDVVVSNHSLGREWRYEEIGSELVKVFNEEQKLSLQKYYNANLLLVECLKSDCIVDLAVRNQIMENLLKPISPNNVLC